MNYSDTYSINMNSDPGKKKLPYVKGNKLFLLFICVLVFHAILVVMPFFILQLSDLLNPHLAVEQVSLVDSPPNDNEIPTEFPSAQRPVNEGIPPKGEETPASLPNLPDIPALPDLPEVKQEEVKEEEPAKPVPPEKPAAEEKTIKKPVKKTAVDKKITKYVSPEKIKISRKKVKHTSGNAKTKKTGKSEAELRAQRIRDLLNAYQKNKGKNLPSGNPYASPYGREGGTGKAGGAGGPKGVTSQAMKEYYEQVRNFLMRSWQQPNTALLNNTRPEVLVLINVDASGRITSAKILRRSGNNAMDSSVEALLQAVKVLPKPPRAMQFTVNVNIVD
ncbi:MAG: TonB family protein [Lentisphaeria bacterium]|nr:TonB family protein [Lentisphaeria bacterium]